MKNTSGMGWDEGTQRPTCSNDVWNTYVKANPNALKFRTKGLRNYIQLAELLEGRQATGEYASSGFEMPRKRSCCNDETPRKRSCSDEEDLKPGSTTSILRPTPKRSHRSKDKVSGSQLLSGIETLRELTVIRSKQGPNLRLLAQAKLAKEFPNLVLKEKIAMWKLFENGVKAEIFVGIEGDEEGATEWVKQELMSVGIESPFADIPWSDSE